MESDRFVTDSDMDIFTGLELIGEGSQTLRNAGSVEFALVDCLLGHVRYYVTNSINPIRDYSE